MSGLITKGIAFAVSAALLASPVTTPVLAQGTKIGNAATVVGKVDITPASSNKKQRVQRKQRIALGDLINTQKKSQLQILLLDRSTYGIGAKSQVRIDRYVYDPDEGRSSVVTFLKGALRWLSGKQGGDNSSEVRTRTGRIGIRGTAVDMLVGKEARNIARDEADETPDLKGLEHDKKNATLVVLRGPGAETLGGLAPGIVDVESAGVTVTLDAPGETAYIPFIGSPPIGPFNITDDGLIEVQDQLAPEVARATKGGGLLDALLPVFVGIGAVAAGAILLDGGDEDVPDSNTTPGGQDIANECGPAGC